MLEKDWIKFISIIYIEALLSKLDSLEKKYIEEIKPLQNDTKVKEYLPKKSPKLSELQRLLKLANTPLFPSIKFTDINGVTLPREDWDMIRGFIAGIDDTENISLVLVICRQNMGQFLWNRVKHRSCGIESSTEQKNAFALMTQKHTVIWLI